MDRLPDYHKLRFNRVDMTDLAARFPAAHPDAVSALKRLIRLDPCAIDSNPPPGPLFHPPACLCTCPWLRRGVLRRWPISANRHVQACLCASQAFGMMLLKHFSALGQ